jgi:hypothetical protein
VSICGLIGVDQMISAGRGVAASSGDDLAIGDGSIVGKSPTIDRVRVVVRRDPAWGFDKDPGRRSRAVGVRGNQVVILSLKVLSLLPPIAVSAGIVDAELNANDIRLPGDAVVPFWPNDRIISVRNVEGAGFINELADQPGAVVAVTNAFSKKLETTNMRLRFISRITTSLACIRLCALPQRWKLESQIMFGAWKRSSL